MRDLKHFSIPYKGMGNGTHTLQYNVDDKFFDAFENSHIKNGKFLVEITLEKKHESGVLSFVIDGTTKTDCDRCMEAIDLPVYGEYTLHIKLSEDGESNEEILYLHPDTSIFNMAPLVYEYILLSVPMIKTYDCHNDEEPPCNFDLLDKIDQSSDNEPTTEKTSGIWDTLNDLTLKN